MKPLSITLSALALLCAASTAQAAIINYQTTLTGAAEFPVNDSPGTGTVHLAYDNVAHSYKIKVIFSGLLGNTTAAHIHCCTAIPFAGTAGVATRTPSFLGFPAGVTAGVYEAEVDMTQPGSFNAAFVAANGGTFGGAEAALFGAMDTGRTYFNLHSSRFPGGEIRGFLVQVPEPASMALFGLGAAALLMAQRRRRASSARAHA